MADSEIRFDGRAIVVTGGGRGLGKAQAQLLAARGARIVVADNGSSMAGSGGNRGPAQEVADAIRAAGGEAVACTEDLSTETGAAGAVACCVDAFGRIDGIIHYASTCPDLTPPEALASRDVELVLRVNCFAGIWLARAAWPHMVEQAFGRLIFTPSAALYGALGNTPYATAKASYLGLVRTLALEGADHGIRVNAVMPSAHTRMTEGFPPGAYADWFFATMTPEKVAAACAFLLSEACEVSGEILAVGGGRIARLMIAEAAGAMDCNSVEDVRDAIGAVLAATDFFFPRDLGERSRQVSARFGADVMLDAGKSYAVRPHVAD